MPLTIELAGVHAENKGAMLMLESAIEFLRLRLPDARLAVSYRIPAHQRRRHGLLATRPADRLGRGRALAWRLLPRPLAHRLGLVKRKDLDVVLDISGFAYGDGWPLEKLQNRLLGTLRGVHGSRPLVILLPQAFGPFENRAHAEAMRQALAHRPLIFARDQRSLDNLVAVDPAAEEFVRLAPDFTNLLKVDPAPGSDSAGALIVPNAKVAQHADPARYEDFLVRAGERLEAEKLKPRFLVHEGEGDLAIAEAVNMRLPAPLPILRPADAREAKSLIAGSGCLVSSRYHALVSALSEGVPALACGWSHKYAALMADYGLPDMLIDLEDPQGWDDCMADLLAMSRNPPDGLRAAAIEQKQAAERMWVQVIETIRQHAGAASLP